MVELPKSIRVGYVDYSVEDWKPSEAHVNGRFGECDRQHMVIRVRADLVPQKKAECLLHEVLHAAYDMGCVESGDEEKIVTILGHQLTQVWRDNPDLVAFMEGVFRPVQ